MCETSLINNSIVGLSKCSFSRRIKFYSNPVEKEKVALSRLNGRLDSLYELLYDSYPSITEDDYNLFSPYLAILIDTLADLSKTYTSSMYSGELSSGIERLNRNISSLKEIDSDILNFRVRIAKNKRFKGLMTSIALLN